MATTTTPPPPPGDAIPAFSLERPRYDQSTYMGRVRKFIDIINPRTLFTSDAELAHAAGLIAQFRDLGGAPPGVSNEQMWAARSTLEAIVHPDTGKPIPLLFRFSAFVPVNLPICVGMLTTNTVVGTVFWQWVNQSYNVAVNHANRNASNPMSNEQIMKAYAAAVGASCGISVGLNQIAQVANLRLLKQFTPFVAVASAGVLNVTLMRYNELQEGIEIKDEEGRIVGKSKQAGRAALTQVALTRVALPAPILVLPPIIINLLNKAKMMPASKRARLVVEVGIVTACLAAAVPLAIGLFPQTGAIRAQDVEPEFQGLKDSKGRPVTSFSFNKGL
ncbi:Sidoreflexin [Plasmodiophora brassicae]|uniref:Sidoreflexin n=2 Tax=Plasmodiophora brassicae TaxID=37360 RepID=A0A3P3YBD5_PLABS|nr:unnamed protein product [Plasmodiophora brassicae]